jgi:hypothetical protein
VELVVLLVQVLANMARALKKLLNLHMRANIL